MSKTDAEIKLIQGFSRRFSKLRRSIDANLSNKALGKAFGVSDAAVSKWESGKGMPAMANACLIAIKYKVSVEWLLTGRGEPTIKTDDSDPVILALKLMSDEDRRHIDGLILSLEKKRSSQESQ